MRLTDLERVATNAAEDWYYDFTKEQVENLSPERKMAFANAFFSQVLDMLKHDE